VGENLEQRDAGEAADVVRLQVTAALQSITAEEAGRCVIAYEPIWAIGTGIPSTGELANTITGYIRNTVRELHGGHAADDIRILYGGSVNNKIITEFVSQPEIDGALVGGASLDPAQFVSIVAQTAEVYRTVTPLGADE
jgi:triosephosphate isomerase